MVCPTRHAYPVATYLSSTLAPTEPKRPVTRCSIVDSPIGTGTGQHFVDTDNVEGVYTDTQVESLFPGSLHNVFVCTNTSGFESFGRELFIFVGHEVTTEWEIIDRSPLSTEIVDSDLGVRDTTVVP